MPIVRIDIRSGRTMEHKSKILDAVRESMEEVIKKPGEDNFQVIQMLSEHSRENFEIPKNKSEMYTIITVLLVAGRTKELKTVLYQTLLKKLNKLNIEEQDLVFITEEPPMDVFQVT